MDLSKHDRVMAEVTEERVRQKAKGGQQNHDVVCASPPSSTQ